MKFSIGDKVIQKGHSHIWRRITNIIDGKYVLDHEIYDVEEDELIDSEKLDALSFIKEQYKNDDICMFDLLASIQVEEIEKAIGSKLSVEDVFELYVESMKWSDGDTFIHRREDCQDEVL